MLLMGLWRENIPVMGNLLDVPYKVTHTLPIRLCNPNPMYLFKRNYGAGVGAGVSFKETRRNIFEGLSIFIEVTSILHD